jgi:capsule polysaccharide export protein KpsE/RkpR
VESTSKTAVLDAPVPEPDEKLDLVSGAALFWSQRLRLLRWLGIGLAVSTALALLLPNRYQSTASLMPPDPQAMSSGAMLAAMAGAASPSATAGLASNLLGAKSASATFLGVIQSRTAQDDLINRFDLRKVYGYKRYIDAREKLAARTSVKEDAKTGVISVTVTDSDAERARDLARAYVEELDKLVAQLSTSSARRERVFLEERLKAVQVDLDGAARELSQFSSRNATLDMQNQGKTLVDAAARLQGELIVAQSEMRGLEAVYSDNNTRVRAARARIAELERQLRVLSGRAETGDGGDLAPGQLYPSLRRLPLLGVTYAGLYRRVKVQEAVYEVLTKQYELAKVQEAREIPTVKVLDQPTLPEKKSFPPRLLIVAVGTFLTALLAAIRLSSENFWRNLEGSDPRRILALEIRETFQTSIARKRRRRRLRSAVEEPRLDFTATSAAPEHSLPAEGAAERP